MNTRSSPVFCAIDVPTLAQGVALAQQVAPHVGGFKLGMEFLYAVGLREAFAAFAPLQRPLFLDLKLHDIPNTVGAALQALLPLHPAFITLHAAGGPAMLRAAVAAVQSAGPARPKLLAVSVLTSLEAEDLDATGQRGPVEEQVLRLGRLARECGVDGAVCSAREIPGLRAALGHDFTLMVPGIRPVGAAAGDQKRVMTPRAAMQAGATHLVIGRPISEAADPAAAAAAIAESLAG